MTYAIAAAAFIVSAMLTRLLCNPDSWWNTLDHPNERSLHHHPVPRGGGLAIVAAVLLAGMAKGIIDFPDASLIWIAAGVVAVASISFLDDRAHVRPLWRLLVHAIAGSALVYAGFVLPSPGFSVPGPDWPHSVVVMVSLLFIVWMINLYNFMDGMDGFAGGMAVFGFGTFALMGRASGHDAFVAVSLFIAAASAGFLVFNFPPARIFMGDVGSSTLGLLAAALSLWGARDGIFPFWAALLVFSPFIADATVTLVWRLLRGHKIWQAHKTHYYQRLVQAGWGHRRTVLFAYAVMLGCGLTALWAAHASVDLQLAAVTGWVIFYSAAFFRISRLASRRR